MTLFKLPNLGFVAIALLLLCFPAPTSQAEDEQGTPTADEAENEPPAREVPNFVGGESPAATPVPTPARAAAEREVAGESEDLGVGKFGSFPFHLSVSLLGGYDDNVITNTTQGKPSAFVTPSAELTYKFGDERTNASLTAGGGLNYYFDRPSDQSYDIDAHAGLSAVHKATPRLTLGSTVYLAYQTEPDFSANVGTNRRSGNFLYSTDRLFGNYDWLPRFGTATSYTLTAVSYDNRSVGQFVDRTEHLFGTEFRFLLWPDTVVVGDLRLQIVSYDRAPLDSVTGLFLAGLEHKFNPRLNISLRGGEEIRSFDEGSQRSEPYFEGILNYTAGRHTTLSWTNRYSLEEPGVSGNQSRTTFRTGLQGKYGFTQRISATVGFFFVHDEYAEGPPVQILPGLFIPGPPAFAEDSLDVNLGARFQINRDFAIDVSYGHTEITSDFSLREYSRNRFSGGFNFSF